MKFIAATWYVILVSIVLVTSTSCTGQVPGTRIANPLNETIAAGATVAKMDNRIFVVFLDRSDAYWFGSDGQGVYRYDGKTIRQFTTKDGLSNDSLREIQEDAAGNIFFTTQRGISKFDGQKMTTLPVAKSDPFDWKLQPGDLWFKGEPGKNGPYRYDGKSLYSLQFPKHFMEDEYKRMFANIKFVYSPYEVYHIYKDSQGNVWFGTGSFGLCKYNGKSLSWLYEDHLTHVPNGGSFGIRSIMEDPQGKFWFCNGRYRYNISRYDSITATQRFLSYERERGIELKDDKGNDIYFMSMVKYNWSSIWLATYSQGIWHYDGKSKTTNYPVKEEGKDVTVFAMYKDLHSKLWVCTHNAGVYTFNGRSFEKFNP